MKRRVGAFYTSCRVSNHVDRKRSIELPHILVDTGAEFTWVDAERLKSIGVKLKKKDNCRNVDSS
jgi:hypothetical protein